MAGADDPHDIGVKPGDVLAGKYRVERVLGVGGMGVVVAAHHIQLDDKVALKFLLPEALQNAEAVARFVREARAAVRIKSEHVARVSDVGQLENGAPYMVMEYLEGRDLAAALEEHGVLPPERAVEFLLQACEAIAEAHALGIVHRDLKPANLFCVRRADGLLSVKVLDFGISKLTSPEGVRASMTRVDAVMGSPSYMSPEQMHASAEVDTRTDIWALGVILFELLTGRVPFHGAALTDIAIKIATAPTPSIRAIRPEVSAGLERVVMRCLQKDRALRFPDVGELAAALEPEGPPRAKGSVERILRIVRTSGLAQGVPSSEPPRSSIVAAGATSERPGAAPTATVTAWGHTGGWKKGKRGALVGASVVAGLAVATLGIVLRMRSGSEARSGPATATSLPAVLPATGLPSSQPLPLPSAVSDSSSRPPTVSPTNLAVAPPPPTPAAPSRAVGPVGPARAAAGGASPAAPSSRPSAPASSAKPAYNPLEHL